MQFEAVTLVPFEPKLIDFSLMSVPQIEWYNTYNQAILNQVRPKLHGDSRALAWLETRTNYVCPCLSHQVQKWKNEL